MNRKQRNERKVVSIPVFDGVWEDKKNSRRLIGYSRVYSLRKCPCSEFIVGEGWGHRFLCKFDDGKSGCFLRKDKKGSRNRMAARLRGIYHKRVDWECPAGRTGYCLNCKWISKCKAIHG